jgi:peptidoglycan/LPS O-acetylase OafA/YrhL
MRVQPAEDAPASAGQRDHLPVLDGLRGVAIAGVLLFHTGLLPGGFLGVDMFFALSGYLITDLLLREAEATGTVSLVAFWGRRIRRLLPALAVVLAVVTVLVWVIGPPDLVRTTLADGPWVQANLVNWHLIAESAGYWDRYGPGRVFEHLWSIAVEEQFYLLWPALIRTAARIGPGGRVQHRVAVLAAAGSVVSLAAMVLLVDPADPTRVYTGTDTRAFSLLLGAVVATRPVRDALGRLTEQWRGAAMVALSAGIAAAWLVADGTRSTWLYFGGLFAHAAASALLIGLCACAPVAMVARCLSWRPIRGLGQISYSLYLWHWPLVVLLPPQWTVVACIGSIGPATLSKYLVEDPVRFRARWARGRCGLVAFAVLMLGLALLWTALPAPAPPIVDVTGLD